MTLQEFVKNHLNYYLVLESDFKNTFQFVKVDKENYETYSDEFLKLIIALGSEIYVLQGLIASLYEPNYLSKKLKDYEVIENNITDIKLLEVEFKENKEIFKPFNVSGYPDWKKVYNNIKHRRTQNATKDVNDSKDTHDYSTFDKNKKWFQYGNLDYVIKMFSVLHALEMIAYKKFVEDDNVKNNRSESIVPTIKSLFKIINLDWENKIYSDSFIISGEMVEIDY